MDEDKEKQRKMEVVDTSDQPAEGGSMVEETVSENQARMNAPQEELVPLFEEEAAEKFRSHWLAIQTKFVDDPRDSVQQANDLVADVIENITRSFADRRDSLEKEWNAGGEISTEDLRQALKQYRSFFERLLSLRT